MSACGYCGEREGHLQLCPRPGAAAPAAAPAPGPALSRADVLRNAEALINGPRAQDYGPPAVNFQRIADLWEPILGASVEPWQVALCLTQLKVARLITSPAHEDSWTDAAGYIALGAEVATGTPA